MRHATLLISLILPPTIAAAPVPPANGDTAEAIVAVPAERTARELARLLRSGPFLNAVVWSDRLSGLRGLRGRADRERWLAGRLRVEVVRNGGALRIELRGPRREAVPLLAEVVGAYLLEAAANEYERAMWAWLESLREQLLTRGTRKDHKDWRDYAIHRDHLETTVRRRAAGLVIQAARRK